jgi:RNA polymerase sigma-32 factor
MKSANLPHISNAKVLSVEEEKALTIQYKANPTQRLADKILKGNIKYVAKLAHQFTRKYNNDNFTFEDFFQEGMIGMKIALDKFDPEKSYNFPQARFTTYAKLWIIASMQQFVIHNWSQVNTNNLEMRARFFGKYEMKDGESRLPLPDLSLNAPISNKEDSMERHDTMADDKLAPEEAFAEQEFSHELKKAINDLLENFNERDQFIIRHRFLTDEPLTLAEIGEKYGFTRERARQLEARCLERLTSLCKNSAQIEEFVEELVA